MRARKNRHQYNLPVQLKYSVILSLTAGTISLIMIFIMAWFIQRNYNLFLGDELGISAQVIEVVKREQQMLEMSLFVVFLISITTMFAASLLVVRKLTGPIMSLRRQLAHYERGDWSREFRLRSNDEFRDLEPIINRIREQQLERKNSRLVAT